jgi:hypothetical protein
VTNPTRPQLNLSSVEEKQKWLLLWQQFAS